MSLPRPAFLFIFIDKRQATRDEDEEKTMRSERPPITPLLAICTIGSATEYCWSAGEAVLVPYLSRHGVKHWVVSMIYLSNPTFGLWIQPLLGRYSDKLNVRLPFVVGLCLLACIGLVSLLTAEKFSHILGLANKSGDTDDDGTVFGTAVIIISFISFGISDICFDCLLIPGRALLDDFAVPFGREEDANALFTGVQMIGRLLALLIASSSMTTSGFWGLYSGVDAHFNAVLSTNVIYLIGTVTVVLYFVRDTGSRHVEEKKLSVENDAASEEANDEQDDFINDYSEDLAGYEYEKDTSHHHSEDRKYQSLLFSSNEEDMDYSSDLSKSASRSISCYRLDATSLLVAVQAGGWAGITAQSFFWTSWRGEQIGSIDLVMQALVAIVTTVFLPSANNYLGALKIWLGSELIFHLLMMSVALTDVQNCFPRIICALCGINYAIHATNALLVAAVVVDDPSRRARTIALVNNSLPMGQLMTALFGGTIAQYFDGFQSVFICFGAVGFLLTALVWIISSSHNVFPTRVNADQERHLDEASS